MLTTDLNGDIVKERTYVARSLAEESFGVGYWRAVNGGGAFTAKQLASRLRVSRVKAEKVLAIAQDGWDSYQTECE